MDMVAPNHKLATTGNQNLVRIIGKKYKLTYAIMVKDKSDTTFKNSYHSIADFGEPQYSLLVELIIFSNIS